MEDLMLRFPYIAKQIFEQLDAESLKNCREVAKSLQEYIDHNNLVWVRIVNIPRKLRIFKGTYLHLAAKKGQTVTFKMILESEEDKNPETGWGETPFHLVCQCGHFKIAEMLLENCAEWQVV